MFTRTDLEGYFLTHKQEAVVWLAAGLLAMALGLSIQLWRNRSASRGVVIALLFTGMLEAAGGFWAYSQADSLRISNVYAYDMNPSQLRIREWPRIGRERQQLVILRWSALGILGAALAMLAFGHRAHANSCRDMLLVLSLQLVLIATAAYLSERKAAAYMQGLEQFFSR